jgi:hypothetical protein
MTTNYYYDNMDANYCRKLKPLSAKLSQLYADGNRYHYMLIIRIQALAGSRFLIKPDTGFVSEAHQSFFTYSWNQNILRGIAHVINFTSMSGYISGAVVTPSTIIANGIQPMFGNVSTADTARSNFERWHLSGKSIKSAWKTQHIVSKVHAGDRKYAYMLAAAGGDPKKVKISEITKQYPGWQPDDGSDPTLVVGSLI